MSPPCSRQLRWRSTAVTADDGFTADEVGRRGRRPELPRSCTPCPAQLFPPSPPLSRSLGISNSSLKGLKTKKCNFEAMIAILQETRADREILEAKVSCCQLHAWFTHCH